MISSVTALARVAGDTGVVDRLHQLLGTERDQHAKVTIDQSQTTARQPCGGSSPASAAM